MSKDNLNRLFERLQGQFDLEQPRTGHQNRFLDKLNPSQERVFKQNTRFRTWGPLSIAASMALVVFLGFKFLLPGPSIQQQIVLIAPEVSNAHFYFASLIEQQLQRLNEDKSPENRQLVDDALVQLRRLENDYKKLEENLVNGGDPKIILNASINNFQTRIDLLNYVLRQVESIKNLKKNNDENLSI
mgnify:FL=1